MSQLIDARDLVVGSYVLDKDGEVRETVYVYNDMLFHPMFRCVNDKRRLDIIAIDEIQPIPLTVEWAKKLGMTFLLGRGLYGLPDPSHDWMLEFEDEYCTLWEGDWSVRVESIHHLQALIWTLKRTWLTITSSEA